MKLGILAIVAALAGPLVLALFGFRTDGQTATFDGPFAVGSLHGFRAALADGSLIPSWIATANGDLGAPIFWIYPRGAYFIASALAALFGPGLDDASAIWLAAALFRMVGILGCVLWLRPIAGLEAALIAAAAYAVMPNGAFETPYVMGGFAQMAGIALFPFALIAMDRSADNLLRRVVWLAPAIAAIALLNLPMVVVAGVMVGIYGAIEGAGSWRRFIRGGLGAACGVVLGLALAGASLVTALLLQQEVAIERTFVTFEKIPFLFTWQRMFQSNWPAHAALEHFGVIIPVAVAAVGLCATRGKKLIRQRTMLLTFVVSVFLITPFSQLAWKYLPILARVQFPGRFVDVTALFSAGILALGLPALKLKWQRTIVGGIVAGAVILVSLQISRSDFRSGAERTAAALADPWSNVGTFVPPGPPRDFWDQARLAGPSAMAKEAKRLTGCDTRRGLSLDHISGGFSVDVTGCTGQVILPVFAFPGWVVEGTSVLPDKDPATGLLRTDVQLGTTKVVLHREAPPALMPGLLCSLVAFLIWVGLTYWASRSTARTASP